MDPHGRLELAAFDCEGRHVGNHLENPHEVVDMLICLFDRPRLSREPPDVVKVGQGLGR
jgi:hypothetical protein